ncbi:DUF11 domain-containing protein [Cellulomonas cellasea]|uniref:DUF11 domain-containing protein n=1 Tax=Cellulomonas cellasea TaxID=43670 RepID=UPI001142302A|nr:DUF11 domain-containing protein [Cellulomonas cellasea]
MRRSSPVLVLALACVVGGAGALPAAPASQHGLGRAGLPAAVTDPVDPRLAFTQDRDELASALVRRVDLGKGGPYRYEAQPSSGDVPLADAAAAHTGEASGPTGVEAGFPAWVSTTGGDADGEVWVDPPDSDSPPVRVTCANDAVETHPVVSPRGDAVAYASDAAGGWDIWVTPLAGSWSGCTDEEPLPAVRITTDAAADTWPAWALLGSVLVFSSDRPDPGAPPAQAGVPTLGDLFGVEVDLRAGGEAGLRRLTRGPDADTQPAVLPYSDDVGPIHVVFTTTRYRSDGSLASLALPDGLAGGAEPEVVPLWVGPEGGAVTQPPSAEAAFAPGGAELLLTTTRDDRFGDVHVTRLVRDATTTPVRADAGSLSPVAAVAGVAESHGAFLGAFVFPDVGQAEARVLVTRRSHDADVADVVAADGRDRRVVGASTETVAGAPVRLDDVGPAYSPDGAELVRAVGDLDPPAPSLPAPGYRLVRAAADGSGAAPLDYAREPGDVDVDPAWSPDGTRVAFVRYRALPGAGYGPARIWVVTLATGDTVQVGEPPGEPLLEHVDPAWSPDSTRLAYSRLTPPTDVAVAVAATPATVTSGSTTRIGVTVSASGPATAVDVQVGFGGLTLAPAATLPRGCGAVDDGAVCRLPGLSGAELLAFDLTGVTNGPYTVTASAAGEARDARPANDSASTVVTVLPVADVELALSPTTVRPGGSVTATVTVAVRGGPTSVDLQLDVPAELSLSVSEGSPCTVATPPRTARCPLPVVSTPLELPVTVTRAGGPDTQGTVSVRAVPGGSGIPDSASAELDYVPDPGPRLAAGTGAGSAFERLTTTPAGRTAASLVGLADAALRAVAAGTGPRRAAGAGAAAAPAAGGVALGALVPARFIPAAPATAELHVMDAADGSGDVTLTDPSACGGVAGCSPLPLDGRHPDWSPDGARLAVERDGAVHLVALAGTGGPDVPEVVTAVTQLTGLRPDGTPTASRASLSVTEDPAWSPDGAELAVAGQPAGQPDQRGIYALAPDGTLLREVAQSRAPETEPAYQPFVVVDEPPDDPAADVAVDVSVDRPETWLGGEPVVATVVVTNPVGPEAAAGVVLTLAYPPSATVAPDPACPPPGTVCALGALAPGAIRTLTATLTFPVPAPPDPPSLEQPEAPATEAGQVRASVTSATPDPVPANDVDAADVTLQRPTLRLLPAVSRPGTVVLAYGENFPPGAAVELEWSLGITVDPGPAFVDPDDRTVRFSVLVVRRDRLGQRTLDATSPDGLFGLVQGDLLVVPRSASPPELIARG